MQQCRRQARRVGEGVGDFVGANCEGVQKSPGSISRVSTGHHRAGVCRSQSSPAERPDHQALAEPGHAPLWRINQKGPAHGLVAAQSLSELNFENRMLWNDTREEAMTVWEQTTEARTKREEERGSFSNSNAECPSGFLQFVPAQSL